MPGTILHHAMRVRMALDDLRVALQNETVGRGPRAPEDPTRLERLGGLLRDIDNFTWLNEVIKGEL